MSGSDAVGDRELDGGCCPELPTEILDSHGIPLLVRLVEPSDEAAIRDLHERCSERALRWRYLGIGPQVEHLLRWVFDRSIGEAVGVFHGEHLVALSNLSCPDRHGVGDVAFLVADAWQGRRIGSQMVTLLGERGRAEGCRTLHADVSLDNGRMRTLFAHRGWTGHVEDGDYSMDLQLV